MRELRIATRKTNPIHNDVPENTTFLLLDQPSEEANTTGTLISKIDEVAINAKTANWKAIVMLVILQSKLPTNKLYHLIPRLVKILIKCIIIMAGFDHESIDSLKLITTLLFKLFYLIFIYKQTDILDPAYTYIYIHSIQIDIHSIQIDTYRWIHI